MNIEFLFMKENLLIIAKFKINNKCKILLKIHKNCNQKIKKKKIKKYQKKQIKTFTRNKWIGVNKNKIKLIKLKFKEL